MYAVGKLHKQTGHRGAELELTDTPKGAKMLTVGSRQSLLYGRMYDKARESGMPEYASCVRWEIEVKAEQARDLNGYMRDNRNEAGTTRAIVKNFWEQRGMTPFWDTFEEMDERPPLKRSKTDETKLAWLQTQVYPTVQGLTDRGKIEPAIRAVFGHHLSDSTVAEIANLILQS